MTAWTSDELARIGAAEELEIAPRRQDGALRKPTTIWGVRHGDDLYVRSYRGRSGAWFQGAEECHEGQIQAGGIEKDVAFVNADHGLDDAIDRAYRTKYGHYDARYVDPMVGAEARATTIKLVPR